MRLLWGLILLAGCYSLPNDPLEGLGVCGNGIVELGEDCDVPSDCVGDECTCGQPGTTVACLDICQTNDDCVTADGSPRYCSAQGSCTPASGEFLPLTEAASSLGKVHFLSVADFDGDGTGDVISQNGDQHSILFGGDDFSISSPLAWTLPSSGSICVGEIDKNTGADILTPTTYGGIATGGNVGREQRSALLSTYNVPNRETAHQIILADANGGAAHLILLRDTAIGLIGGTPLNFPNGLLGTDAFPAATLDLEDNINTGTDEGDNLSDIIIGFQGTRNILVAETIQYDGLNTGLSQKQLLQLPFGVNLAKEPIIIDDFGNGWVDLFLQGSDGNVYLFHHDGVSQFNTSPAGPISSFEDVIGWGPVARDENDNPRSGHIRETEISYPFGINTFEFLNLGSPWRESILVDIDGDGREEVVLRKDDGIDVLFPKINYTWNKQTFGTPSTPSDLLSGDFNGDIFPDIAYLDEAGDFWVLPGSAGGLTPPILSSSFGVVSSFATGKINPSRETADTLDDIVVLGETGISVGFGQTNSTMPSTLMTADFSDTLVLQGPPTTCTTGDFNGDSIVDVALLSRAAISDDETKWEKSALWFSLGEQTNIFEPSVDIPYGGTADCEGDNGALLALCSPCASLQNIDLNNTGSESLIVVDQSETCQGNIVWPNRDANVLVTTPGEGLSSGNIQTIPGVQGVDRMIPFDYDEDDDLDLLISYRNQNAAETSVAVVQNSNGTLDFAAPTTLTTEGYQIALVGMENSTVPVLLRTDDIVPMLFSGGVLSFGEALVTFESPLSVSESRLTAGDVNGDGLDDLIIVAKTTTERSLRVSLQKPAPRAGDPVP